MIAQPSMPSKSILSPAIDSTIGRMPIFVFGALVLAGASALMLIAVEPVPVLIVAGAIFVLGLAWTLAPVAKSAFRKLHGEWRRGDA